MNSIIDTPLIPITELLETIIDNRGKSCPTQETGFPLIATNCIKHSSIYPTFENIRYVSDEVLQTWFRAELKPRDILFVNKGTPGRVCLVPDPITFCVAQDMIGLRADPDRIYYKYLFAILRSDYIQEKIKNFHVGIAIPHFKKSDMDNLLIPVPEMSLQIKIGDLYCRLSEKIENNNKINLELESMAKTIYDYWFSQFEFPNGDGKPYKFSGGKMVWNEELKKEIPKGWKVGNLYDIAEFINGLACQKYRPVNHDKKIPVIKIKEMHEGISESTEYVKEDIPEKNIINDGDILFSWSATLETMIWSGGKGGLNQHIFKVIPRGYAKYYVYMQLSAYIVNFVHIAEARKTTMGHITTDHLQQSRIAIPPKKIVDMYDEKIQGVFDKIICNSKQNRELILLRDFLLPLLINGQVGFKERG